MADGNLVGLFASIEASRETLVVESEKRLVNCLNVLGAALAGFPLTVLVGTLVLVSSQLFLEAGEDFGSEWLKLN